MVCSHYFSKTTGTPQCLCCAKSRWLQQPPESLEAGSGAPVLCSLPTVKEKYFHSIYLHDPSSQSLEASSVAIIQTLQRWVGGGLDFHPQNFDVSQMSEFKVLPNTRRVPEQHFHFAVILCLCTELFLPKCTHWEWLLCRFHREVGLSGRGERKHLYGEASLPMARKWN